jgi:hypothetical protein|tara:strand:+ start:477 stop:662 length:186 start_codon:yes stop_codon:yes gene_type:complete
MSLEAKTWLNKNEWPDIPVDNDAFPHYTSLSKIMEQYAKEYHAKQLNDAREKELTKYTKFL